MSTLLSSITEVITFVFGQVPEVLELIASEPLLLLGVGLMVAGAICGFASRFIRLS